MTAKEKILKAAREEFFSQGYNATRMRSISERAGINKGLLHYYFKSKEALIIEVFQSTFSELFGDLEKIFSSADPLEKQIERSVDHYISFMMRQERLPMFIVQEMDRDNKNHVKRLQKAGIHPPFHLLMKSIEEGKKNQTVRQDLNTRQFMLNMLSMMLFPFIGKPMAMYIHNMNHEVYAAMMNERKTSVADALIRQLKP